ncbi:MAG: hypothetical protein O7D93_08920 [Acidobacteria bacterium]|nr:hypothetical protein [Acidobacteriota bacterium]
MQQYQCKTFQINSNSTSEEENWLEEKEKEGYRCLQRHCLEFRGPKISQFVVVVIGRRVYDGAVYWDFAALRRLEDLMCFEWFVSKEIELLLLRAYLDALEQLANFRLGQAPDLEGHDDKA